MEAHCINTDYKLKQGRGRVGEMGEIGGREGWERWEEDREGDMEEGRREE